MPRQEVSDYWKSILLLSNPRSIDMIKTIGYQYNLRIVYGRGLIYEYKYNINRDMTIDRDSIDLYIIGKYNKTLTSLSSNEREEKLLENFITFLYTCHNNPNDWKSNYDTFSYNTYKLLRKFTCTIL